MATKTGTEISERHWMILRFAFDYYLKKKIGPLYQSIETQTGVTQKELESLFPQGLISVYSWLGIPISKGQGICKQSVSIDVDHFREVYLDYGSTTPVRKEIIESLNHFYLDPSQFGNPSSGHHLGKLAFNIIYHARLTISESLNVKPERIFFTSGGTESNNSILKGIAFYHLKTKGHIITSKIEHSSILKSLKFLESIGFRVTYLDVSKEGLVSPDAVEKHIASDTILVSLLAVNNEIGTINPIADIGAICQRAKIPLMIDGVQGYGKIPLKPEEMGISFLSLSGHKIYAPKGIGCFYAKENIPLIPLLHGGDQESGIRPGTENVAQIYAFGLAAKLAHAEMASEWERIRELQNYFLTQLKKVEKHYLVNGSLEHKIPHILNIGFRDVDSGSILLSLNKIGIYVSAGSACTVFQKESSHVIQALGINTKRTGSIRFCFGMHTKKEDIDYLIKYLPAILRQLRGSM
jgi:cysteine desulfurase